MAGTIARRLYLRNAAAPTGAPADHVSLSRAMTARLPAGQMYGGTATAQLLAATPAPIGTGASSIEISSASTAGDTLGFVTTWSTPPLAKQTLHPGNWALRIQGMRFSPFGVGGVSAALYTWDPVGHAVRQFLWDSAQKISQGFSVVAPVFQPCIIPAVGVDVTAGDLLVLELWIAGFTGSGIDTSLQYGGYEEWTDVWSDSVSPASFLEPPQPVMFQDLGTDGRNGLPVWTLIASRDAGVTEQISYPSDLQVSRNGNEMHEILRSVPDRALVVTPRTLRAAETERLNQLLAIGQWGYRVPYVRDAVLPGADIASAAASITLDTVGRAFVAGEQAILWLTPDRYEVVDVTGISSTALTLAAGQPVVAWDARNTYVMPLVLGFFVDQASVAREGRDTGEGAITLRIQAVADPLGGA